MKYLAILAVIITLPCCTTSTTYHADGSKTVVKGIDPRVWDVSDKAVNYLADQTSSK